MNCFYHPDREAIGICISCGKPTCVECKVDLKGKFYCNPCVDGLIPVSNNTAIKNPTWFERHLNWTVILGCIAGNIASLLLLIVIGIFIAIENPYTFDEVFDSSDVFITVINTIVSIGVAFSVAGWTLSKKSRSLWWLLILFLPFGLIVFLCLENKTKRVNIPKLLI